ncbi:MAG: RIP metalloprotease RseP [Paludibacteraceae bacterium]|nr:RIP metalloprotease RseP [Paludibacteraceae bacterium]
MSTIVTILQFFASLSLLVLVHEFGHYLMARIFKVRVEKFQIFFGNPIVKYKPKNSDTEYGIGWLPLGGYVKIAGMIDESLDQEQMKRPVQDWEFRSKPAWQRLLIMIMGVVFNFIFALLLYCVLSFAYGEKYIPFQNMTHGMSFSETAKEIGFQDGDILYMADSILLEKPGNESFRQIVEAEKVTVIREGEKKEIKMPEDFMQRLMASGEGFISYRIPFVVDSVLRGSRAEMAQFQAGDSIVAFIGDSLTEIYISDAIKKFSENKNIPLSVIVARNGGRDTLTLTPDHNGKVGAYMKPINAFYTTKSVTYGPIESIGVGISRGVELLSGYVSDMKYVFTKEGAQSVGGFLSIGSLFPYPFNAQIFWEITAFLSLILAFMNILPIPALDGGHLMFLIYEIITRKKPSQKALVNAQIIGMAILLFLLIFANVNDLFRFFGD